MNKLVISVLGQDRPGIIAAITHLLYELDCNVENISQTILQTEFSGIFIIGAPPGVDIEDLRRQLTERLAPLGQTVHLKPFQAGPAFCPSADCQPFVIVTKGPDQKGLVARITKILASYGVNVTNLQAVFKGGLDPSNNIMIYEVDIPLSVNQKALRGDLREKADELGLEISIQHRRIFEALNRI
jgi:glycine cleavage system transcriptional repressor